MHLVRSFQAKTSKSYTIVNARLSNNAFGGVVDTILCHCRVWINVTVYTHIKQCTLVISTISLERPECTSGLVFTKYTIVKRGDFVDIRDALPAEQSSKCLSEVNTEAVQERVKGRVQVGHPVGSLVQFPWYAFTESIDGK